MVRIGRDWAAIVREDGTVVVQFLSQVPLCGTSQVLDLSGGIDDSQREVFDRLEDDRIAVRTLVLGADGSVYCDQDAISPKGVPEEPFQVIPPVINSVSSYFKRRSGKSDW